MNRVTDPAAHAGNNPVGANVINKLVQLLIAVFLIALIAFGLDWVMLSFGVVQPFRNIVWCIFGLIVLLGVIGLLGYGPFAGQWKNGTL